MANDCRSLLLAGSSISDGISSDVASLQYTSIDDLAALVVSEGKGSPI